MPNGHQDDLRPLWQRVKDMQLSKRRTEKENEQMGARIRELEATVEQLKGAIKIVGGADADMD